MKSFKQFLEETKDSDHIYFIHGGREFEHIDPKHYGEPGNEIL